jgi:hypothetical protein
VAPFCCGALDRIDADETGCRLRYVGAGPARRVTLYLRMSTRVEICRFSQICARPPTAEETKGENQEGRRAVESHGHGTTVE